MPKKSDSTESNGAAYIRQSMECGVDDLALLPDLNEGILLQQILARFQRDNIYTYIGDILLAVNPYKTLDIYSPQMMSQYTGVMKRSALPPHIFAVSDCAYSNMCRHKTNQCCVVSGESGAGKTENTKLLVHHIVSLCQGQSTDLLQRIVKVNPLLEAFGNARTVMNNNSSRFGKLIELQFDHNARLTGAVITEYLLEKSRVVKQNAGERNYHIFYYLFAGLEPTKLSVNLLKTPSEHSITSPPDGTEVFSDSSYREVCKSLWTEVKEIMRFIGFSGDQYEGVVAVLTAILHITDIRFVHDKDTDGVFIENEELLEITSVLLGLHSEELIGALIANVTKVRGEEIIALKDEHQARDGRDALAKFLYEKLFTWIIRQINSLLDSRRIDTSSDDMLKRTSIAILDIYGFENFPYNSFEQLCINSANEQLQTFFNRNVFRNELDSYAAEGIQAKSIKFTDNDQLIKLLFDPLGAFSLIDEESRFPKASDLTLMEKLSKNLKPPLFQRVKQQSLLFSIQHYAGPVTYNVYGFLEKNRDTLSANLMHVISSSQSSFVQDLFVAPSPTPSDVVTPESGGRSVKKRTLGARKSVILNKPLDFTPSAEPKSKSLEVQLHRKSIKVKNHTKEEPLSSSTKTIAGFYKLRSFGPTFGMKLNRMLIPVCNTNPNADLDPASRLICVLKNSLKELIAKLNVAEPHFVRCLKPNADKQSNLFEIELVTKQLRYTGVLDTVAIRQQGYSIRLPFENFINSYQFIAYPMLTKVAPCSNSCDRILKEAGVTSAYLIGKTRVFLRYDVADQLNAAMQAVGHLVIASQAHVRAFLARRAYRHLQQSVQRYQHVAVCLGETIISASLNHATAQRTYRDEDRGRKEAEQRQQRLAFTDELLQKKLFRPSLTSPPPPTVSTLPPPVARKSNGHLQFSDQNSVNMLSHVPNRSSDGSDVPNIRPSPTSPPPPTVSTLPPPVVHKSDGHLRDSDQHSVHLVSHVPNRLSDGSNGPKPAVFPKTTSSSSAVKRISKAFQALPLPKEEHERDVISLYLPHQQSSVETDTLQDLMDELIARYSSLTNPSCWCKLHYMEHSHLVFKCYVSEWVLAIDSSDTSFIASLGKGLGLTHMDILQRSDTTVVSSIMTRIGEGVHISRDSHGNVYALRKSECDIVVRGHQNKQFSCLSDEILQSSGKLPRGTNTKIYDIDKFMSHMKWRLQQQPVDIRQIQMMSMVCISFEVDEIDDSRTPCWINLINFCALDRINDRHLVEDIGRMPGCHMTANEQLRLQQLLARLPKRPMAGASS